MDLQKTGVSVETGHEQSAVQGGGTGGWQAPASPLQPLGSAGSSAPPITGSCWGFIFVCLGLFFCFVLVFFEHRKALRMPLHGSSVCCVLGRVMTIPGFALGSLRCVVVFLASMS